MGIQQVLVTLVIGSCLIVANRSSSLYTEFFSGIKKPLDKIDEDDISCCDGWNPTIELHMQKHPNQPNRFVNVIVMENVFSSELMTKWPELENQLSYAIQANNSDKFVRVASDLKPPPLVTFGNQSGHLKWREALPETKAIEKVVQRTTTFLFQLIDAAIVDVMEELVDCLLARSTIRTTRSAKRRRLETEKAENATVFKLPVTNGGVPHDVPDSIVSQASRRNNPYGHHSDSTPDKHDLCDNSEENPLHGDLLRVSTVCFSDSDEKIISLRHGIPTGSASKEHQFCKYWGFFRRNDDSTQVFIKNTTEEGIAIGGASHLHIQLPGSQGELHHYITATRKECVRFVHSCRHLKSLNLAGMIERRNKLYSGRNVRMIKNGCHQTSQLYARFNNKIIFPSSSQDHQEDGNETSTQKQKKIGPASYINGEFEEIDVRNRAAIVSMVPSVKPYDLCLRPEVVEDLTNVNTSMVIRNHVYNDRGNRGRTETTDVLVGYPVVETKDGCRKLRSGEILQRSVIESMTGIRSNSNKKEIFAQERMDFLILRNFAKNDPSLVENLIQAFCKGVLKPLVIRGVGGVPTICGSKPLPSHGKGATRLAPTHSIATSQQVQDTFMTAILDAFRRDQCINICFDLGDDQIAYIGLFRIKAVEFKELNENELLEKMKAFEQEFQKGIATVTQNPEAFPKDIEQKLTLSQPDRLLALSMATRGGFIKLEPIDKDQPSKTEEEELRWNLVRLDESHLKVPILAIDQEVAKQMWNPGEDMACYSVSSFLSLVKKHSPFGYLTAAGKNMLGLPMMDQGAQQEHEVSLDDAHASISQLHDASLHASFNARERGCDLTSVEGNNIYPLRSFFDGVSSDKLRSELRLASKPLLTRPIHPCILSDIDPVVLLAQISTKSYQKIKAVEDITEAWDDVFQCIICSVFNPSSLLELTNGKRIPTPSEANSLLSTLKTYDWAARFIHPIFRGVFTKLQDVEIFIKALLEMKTNLFEPSDATISPSRSDILSSAIHKLQIKTNLIFTSFHMHVVMRTIECCIDLPFGEIDRVHFGYGSNSAAICFLDEYKKANNLRRLPHSEENLCKVVKWMLEAWNQKVKEAIDNNDPYIEDELKVLQLSWVEEEEEKGYLIHSNGRRFNINDIEHGLCFYYVLHQHTLPSRNISTSVNIDGDKYLPIRYSSSKYKSAATLPIMVDFKSKQDEIRKAYLSLVTNKNYKNRFLSNKFKIDIDDDELKEKNIIQINTNRT